MRLVQLIMHYRVANDTMRANTRKAVPLVLRYSKQFNLMCNFQNTLISFMKKFNSHPAAFLSHHINRLYLRTFHVLLSFVFQSFLFLSCYDVISYTRKIKFQFYIFNEYYFRKSKLSI